MGIHVNCSGVRYAVLRASSHKDRPEGLVIAYQGEEGLRNLIAAPSIFKLGFASRREAMKNLRGLASDAAPSKQELRIATMLHAPHANGEFAGGREGVKHRGIRNRILQSVLAVFIALFYSQNLVSVMIRMALGASF